MAGGGSGRRHTASVWLDSGAGEGGPMRLDAMNQNMGCTLMAAGAAAVLLLVLLIGWLGLLAWIVGRIAQGS